MDTAIVYDCEYIMIEGSQSRFWCGPRDPDPIVAQLGAVKIGLTDDYPILDTQLLYIKPLDRSGAPILIDPAFTALTGVTQHDLDTLGISLVDALAELDRFSDGAQFWSWGKDELNLIAISCFVAGLTPPIPATRFRNACDLLLAAGMPYEDLKKTRSNTLSAYFDVPHPPARAHDALGDALSVTYTVQHLLRNGALSRDAFGGAE